MLRISRMADYGVVLATRLATLADGELRSVSALADGTGIPQPTASKVLKALGQRDLVESTRGARGGYRLSRAPSQICVAEVIAAIEGPIGVTECGIEEANDDCDLATHCDVRGNWQLINRAILSALESITLEQMAAKPEPVLVRLGSRRSHRPTMEERS